MARSFTIPTLRDAKGKAITMAYCRAWRADTHALVETQYTDANGDATFSALPDNVDCSILCSWHEGHDSEWFFSEAPPTLGDLDGNLDDIADGAIFGRVKVDDLTLNRIDYDKLEDGSTYKRALSANLTAEGLWLQSKISGAGALATANNLDDVANGTTYSKVLTTDISAGHILLSSVVQSSSYKTVSNKEKNNWNAKPDNMDEIANGATYGKLLLTDISAGHLKLTSSTVVSGEWYDQSGVEIDATHGINIYGTANALTTRATKTGTIQCYVGADGAIYAGAGAVKLNSTGIVIDGKNLRFYNGATHIGIMGKDTNDLSLSAENWDLWLTATNDIHLTAGTISDSIFLNGLVECYSNVKPYTGYAGNCGTTTAPWDSVVQKVAVLKETTTPSDVTDFGKLYTKSDNKLYFQDGAGTEHTVAFV